MDDEIVVRLTGESSEYERMMDRATDKAQQFARETADVSATLAGAGAGAERFANAAGHSIETLVAALRQLNIAAQRQGDLITVPDEDMANAARIVERLGGGFQVLSREAASAQQVLAALGPAATTLSGVADALNRGVDTSSLEAAAADIAALRGNSETASQALQEMARALAATRQAAATGALGAPDSANFRQEVEASVGTLREMARALDVADEQGVQAFNRLATSHAEWMQALGVAPSRVLAVSNALDQLNARAAKQRDIRVGRDLDAQIAELRRYGQAVDATNANAVAAWREQATALRRYMQETGAAREQVERLNQTVRQMHASFNRQAPARLGLPDFDAVDRGADRAARSTGAFATAVGRLGAAAGVYIGVDQLARAIGAVARAGMEGEQAQIRMGAVLRATGDAAGLTARELNQFADQMQDLTLFDDEQIRNASATLLTFKNVSRATFTDTIRLAADLSSVFGMDLQAATVQLGKALEDPVQGLTALRRVGVSFTASQRNQIQALVESNRLLDAQKIILEALRGQVGGVSEEMRTGMTGAVTGAKNAWNDFLEALGRSEGNVRAAQRLLGMLKNDIDLLRRTAFPSQEEVLDRDRAALFRYEEGLRRMGRTQEDINRLRQAAMGQGTAPRSALLWQYETLEDQGRGVSTWTGRAALLPVERYMELARAVGLATEAARKEREVTRSLPAIVTTGVAPEKLAEQHAEALATLQQRAQAVANELERTRAAGGNLAPVFAEANRLAAQMAQHFAHAGDRFGQEAQALRDVQRILADVQRVEMIGPETAAFVERLQQSGISVPITVDIREANAQVDAFFRTTADEAEAAKRSGADMFAPIRQALQDVATAQALVDFNAMAEDQRGVAAARELLARRTEDLAAAEQRLADQLRAAGVSAEQIRIVMANLRELRQQAGVETAEPVRDLSDNLLDVARAGRGVLAAANSVGAIGDEAVRAVDDVLALITSIQKLGDAKGALATAGGLLGVAGAGISLLGGLFDRGPSPAEQARNDLTRRNNEALAELRRALDDAADTMAELAGAQRGLGDIDTAVLARVFANVRLGGFVNVPGGSRADLDRELRRVGMTFEQLQAQAQRLGLSLLDATGRINVGAFQTLMDAIQAEADARRRLASDLTGRLNTAELLDRLTGVVETPARAIERELAALRGLKVSEAVLAPFDDLDVTTEEGARQMRQALADLLVALRDGTLPLEAFGNLRDADELAGFIRRTADALDGLRDASRDATQQMQNVPQGFRIALERWRATLPEPDAATRPPATGPATGPALPPGEPGRPLLPPGETLPVDDLRAPVLEDRLDELRRAIDDAFGGGRRRADVGALAGSTGGTGGAGGTGYTAPVVAGGTVQYVIQLGGASLAVQPPQAVQDWFALIAREAQRRAMALGLPPTRAGDAFGRPIV